MTRSDTYDASSQGHVFDSIDLAQPSVVRDSRRQSGTGSPVVSPPRRPASPSAGTSKGPGESRGRATTDDTGRADPPVATRTPGAVRRGRHSRRRSTGAGYLGRRGLRFFTFSAIGGTVFVLGFGLQAVLTSLLHVPPLVSYFAQAVFSVELSFLLNRWLTWRDRGTPFWGAFGRFNAQKTMTIALNFVLYAGLLRLGMNYLLANVVLTAVFTVVNYLFGDKWVFASGRRAAAEPAFTDVPVWAEGSLAPGVSVVIPCRGNERTIEPALRSLLEQDYPGIREIVLIGSPGDTTWDGLRGIVDADRRLTIMEFSTPPGVRDANFKRDAAIRMTTSDLVCLVDSDIVLPRDWMSRAVAALLETGVGCVAGGMKSIRDDFWGRFTDSTVIGAKTPRVPHSYIVNEGNFGAAGRKPPITANVLFTRRLYEACPIDPSWSHGSYEDYEWFWRVVTAGFEVQVNADLFGWHHHRRGLSALVREYRRSSRGCAYFVRAHPESPFSRLRFRQAVCLPILGPLALSGAAAAIACGYVPLLATVVLGGLALLTGSQLVDSRRLESLVYPFVGLLLGLVFTGGLITYLLRSKGAALPGPVGISTAPPSLEEDFRVGPAADWAASCESNSHPHLIGTSASEALLHSSTPVANLGQSAPRPRWLRILLNPLTAICVLQAGLSLTLVWSNTAFTDEAQYLWTGHLEISHWLHGTTLPPALDRMSGSPIIYPPLGALADAVGGLTSARVMSLILMLVATMLLHSVTRIVYGPRTALIASVLWAVSEPAIRLGAFATYDALSVFLMALSVWLAVQAGNRRHSTALIAGAAVALGMANTAAYSSLVIDPVVGAFTFLLWLTATDSGKARFTAFWILGGSLALFGTLLTYSSSWHAFLQTIDLRGSSSGSAAGFIIKNVWLYTGFYAALAFVGIVIAVTSRTGRRRLLLVVTACPVFLIPLVQFHYITGTSFDERLVYGIWFAVITVGYGCSQILRLLPAGQPILIGIFCGLILCSPAANNWEIALGKQESWGNSTSFIASLKPIVGRTDGSIFLATNGYVARYYIPETHDWDRWSTNSLTLDPPSEIPKSAWIRYYLQCLRKSNDGAVALFYSTTFPLPAGMLLPSSIGTSRARLLGLMAAQTAIGHGPMQGLPALTEALEGDPSYRLVSVGDASSGLGGGIYAIWEKVTGK